MAPRTRIGNVVAALASKAKANAKTGGRSAGTARATTAWQPQGQPYPRLVGFDAAAAGLSRTPGVCVVWHLGVRPQWLKVAASADLAATIAAAATAAPIVAFQPNGGLYVAWLRCDPPRAAAIAAHLIGTLSPRWRACDLPGETPPAAVAESFPLPPGVA
jgi:hypothetical protein